MKPCYFCGWQTNETESVRTMELAPNGNAMYVDKEQPICYRCVSETVGEYTREYELTKPNGGSHD